MIDANHLLHEVIRPVLQDLKLNGVYAEMMVLGTACVESHCGLWLTQLGQGPAKGIYQMEPATHNDHWTNFLSDMPDLAKRVNRWRVCFGNGMGADEMTGNLYYATAMCRIHYYRRPELLPNTLPGQAAYYKRFYNTELGKASEQDYLNAWQQFAPATLF